MKIYLFMIMQLSLNNNMDFSNTEIAKQLGIVKLPEYKPNWISQGQ